MEDNQTTPQATTTFADVKLPSSSPATPITVGGSVSPVASETVANSPAPTATNVPVQSDDSSSQPTSDQPANQPLPAKKGGSHMVAILIAVLVFLLLAGAVVYVYMKSNTSKITRKDTKTSASIAPATAKDVDATTKTIDDNLVNIDADKDFTTTDLSDATLGL